MCCMAPELAHALTTADPAQLGARIKAARVAAGLTQPQLAGADASVAFLSRIETGQRRPSAELIETLAGRLGVTVDFLVIGEGWEEARRLELQLDHAELSLVGGDAGVALDLARGALEATTLAAVPGGQTRARYVEAAALDALGDPSATAAFESLLAPGVEQAIRLKSATALCRIWRERGHFERAVSVAKAELGDMESEVIGTEEGIRLVVTMAAALFVSGHTFEAAELCDRAIVESERLSSPVARASAYWNASMIRAEAGDISESLSLAKRALHLLENTERVRDLGRLRTTMSAIMLRSDPPRVEDARAQLQLASTELDWSEASPTDRCRNLHVNAQALFLAGEVDEAETKALSVLEATGDQPLLHVDAESLLGQIAWSRGDRDGAHEWYRAAIRTLTSVGADREAAQLWFEIGTLAAQAGLVAESADAFRRAAASTGLTARLPVVTQPATSSPRTTPASTPAGHR